MIELLLRSRAQTLVNLKSICNFFLRSPSAEVRIKSVVNYCSNLISDVEFVKLHHKYQVRLNPSLIAMDEYCMFSTRLNPCGSSSPLIEYEDVAKLLDPLARPRDVDVVTPFVGYCNGLICFHVCSPSSKFLVFNPATGAVTWVQPCFPGTEHFYRFIHGFGYDSKDDDFRIVVFDNSVRNTISIYSLRSNSWRTTKSSYPEGCAPGDHLFSSGKCRMLFLNNALHWPIFDKMRIMSFDLSTEEIHELPMPKIKKKEFELSSPDGSHLHLYYHNGHWDELDIWIMKEYGVKHSWAKLCSIPMDDEGFDCRQFMRALLVGYLKGGTQILIGTYEIPYDPVYLSSYEFKTKKVERLKVFDGLPENFRFSIGDCPSCPYPMMIVKWAESLFPLSASTN